MGSRTVTIVQFATYGINIHAVLAGPGVIRLAPVPYVVPRRIQGLVLVHPHPLPVFVGLVETDDVATLTDLSQVGVADCL